MTEAERQFMQQQKIYTVRDSKSESYQTPFYMKTHGEAERFLKDILAKQPDQLPGWYQLMNKFPEDYDLFWLGSFDSETGKIEHLDTPQHMVKVVNLKQ